ncbi:hypothetical protein PIL02S_02728 [Paenibacillus illinoisensis]|uniref:Uncharacterized protein n=1 Tax=Paenibacillus illinoisensis TaxID=59845 RepID=A0A2W0CYP2_9BACL|nr:hypothetical protein PIL02S_02728 [Paenibacillus illinoisensis]
MQDIVSIVHSSKAYFHSGADHQLQTKEPLYRKEANWIVLGIEVFCIYFCWFSGFLEAFSMDVMNIADNNEGSGINRSDNDLQSPEFLT